MARKGALVTNDTILLMGLGRGVAGKERNRRKLTYIRFYVR